MAPLSPSLALSLPALEQTGVAGAQPTANYLLNAAGTGHIVNAANNGNIKPASG